MLIAAEKIALERAYEPKLSAPSLTSYLGEGLRQALLFPALGLFISMDIIGADKLTNGEAYLFVANHSSHLDTPIILAALPLHYRLRLRVAAAADYFFSRRWKGALVSLLLNAFPFERRRPGCLASLAHAEHLLHQGQSLLIFPEGTRTTDGRLRHFKRGIGQIINHSGTRVVPIWIDGTFAALPKGATWPRPQRVLVKFGTPLHFAPDTDPSQITAEIEQAVRSLSHQS